MSRLALTGFGMVCAVGRSVAEAWPKILAGERGIGPVTLFDTTGQKTSLAAEVKGLEVPHDHGPLWSRTDAMALFAAREAMTEAKLDPKRARVGFIVGGTTGGMYETEDLLARMHKDPALRTPNPDMIAHPLSATVDRVGKALGPFVRARTVCSACSSGANAFALGAAWIEMGLCDAVVVGGSDGLCRLTFTGFNALGAIDVDPARPFDVARRGLTIGEGAGFAVLESASHAAQRGAHWDVELAGFGITSDAHHITNPAEDGTQAARAIALALARAGLEAKQVGYINAHGTATPLNDAMEARAVERAGVGRAWISSTKGVMGHTLGAAGAIEAVITALSIREGALPPTAGLVDVDPQCANLRHVPIGLREKIDVAISSSFGFGGVDTVLALARKGFAPDRDSTPRAVYVSGAGTTSSAGALAGEANLALLGPDSDANVDPTAGLDPARARRLDRAARLGTAAAKLAGARAGDGVIFGTSYGDADGSAAFLAKLYAKGPRLVPPADFPNLVPSSPTGHVSIYLGLHGPAIAVADLGTSGESGFATAYELIAAHAADAIVAGSVEGPSDIAANSIAPAFRALEGEAPETGRTEGGAALRLTNEKSAIRVAQVIAGHDARAVLALVSPPSANSMVFVGEITEGVRAALSDSPLHDLPLRDVVAAVGRHEGLGGFALAAATAVLLAGQISTAVILGASPGRTYLIVLTLTELYT